MKFKRFGLTLACIGGSLAIASASAQAFSFGDIGGIVGDLSPMIDQTLGIDISPYADKIANSAGFADAVLSGNWSSAAKTLGNTLGEYGIIAPKKLQIAIKESAQAKYSTTGKLEDFGLGPIGAEIDERMSTQDAVSGIQADINMGDEAQKAWVQKGEILAQSVQRTGQIAAAASKETNSLTVLKGQTGVLAELNKTTAQGVSETKSNGRSLYRIEQTLSDMRTAANADKRSKLRNLNETAGAATSRAGTFAGFASARQSESAQ